MSLNSFNFIDDDASVGLDVVDGDGSTISIIGGSQDDDEPVVTVSKTKSKKKKAVDLDSQEPVVSKKKSKTASQSQSQTNDEKPKKRGRKPTTKLVDQPAKVFSKQQADKMNQNARAFPPAKSSPPPKAAKMDAPIKYDHSQDSSDYAMEIRTARPDSVKKVIEIISPLLTDAVLRFQEDGVYIFAMDAVRVAFVSAHLKAEHFEFYSLKRTFDIGVDTSNLNKILSSVQKYDSLSFIIEDEERSKNLLLCMEATQRSEVFMAVLYGIDPKANNYEIPDQHYDSIMTLPAQTFQNYIHSLSQLSPIVTFKTDNKVFVMEIKSEFGEAWKIIKPCESSMRFMKADEMGEIMNLENNAAAQDENGEDVAINVTTMDEQPEDPDAIPHGKEEDDSEPQMKAPAQAKPKSHRSYKEKHKIEFEGKVISATHLMKYLKVFCKATPLSQFVYMFFQDEEPLVLSYDIRGIGTLLYCICDVSEKNNENGDEEQ